MKIIPVSFLAAFTCLLATTGRSAEPASAGSLSFLSGLWRGTSSTGLVAEELISSSDGGVMLSAGREFKDGQCVFYDLVVFATERGVLTLTPHPRGKKSNDVFPLLSLDPTAKRAVFENLAHDFPKRFVYELVAPDQLRITLTGEAKGQARTETYDLKKKP